MIPVLYVDDNSDLLTIGKRYLELGGKIWVESEGEGKGTTVCFTLPGAGQSRTDKDNNR